MFVSAQPKDCWISNRQTLRFKFRTDVKRQTGKGMQNVVIDKPYVPVPPHRGRVWPMILGWYVPRMLRKKYGVTDLKIVNAQRLAESIAAGHGVLLTPNHCRDEDPFVLARLGSDVGSPFFMMASAHLFMQEKLQAFLLSRAGAFSVYREGIPKDSSHAPTIGSTNSWTEPR
jgi:hypothetical protein